MRLRALLMDIKQKRPLDAIESRPNILKYENSEVLRRRRFLKCFWYQSTRCIGQLFKFIYLNQFFSGDRSRLDETQFNPFKLYPTIVLE